MDALKTKVAAHFNSDAALSVMPIDMSGGGIAGYAWMPLFALAVFLFVQWWAAWYPGAEPGGGGYIAQRIFSARTERDGLLATLWFNIAHYALRPWPWILTALCVVVLYPNLEDPAEGYLMAVIDLLPAGLKGLLVAAFAAAYMSTIATQLNWGASYFINDLYLRFGNPDAPRKKVVLLSRVATVLVFLLSGISTYWM